MSTLIGAMDATQTLMQKQLNINNTECAKQFGENIHPEYKWSNFLKENILQLYFQVTQTNNSDSNNKLKLIYRNLIENILNHNSQTLIHRSENSQNQSQQSYNLENEKFNAALTIYKIIGQTRDIIAGKGLYNLSYMMIAEWARYSIVGPPQYKELCKYLADEAIKSFVYIETENHPYGSWKDIKYFCNYWKSIQEELAREFPHITYNKSNHIMQTILNLICTQLKEDELELNINPDTKNLSLLAKWLPREKSNKFGWLTHHIAYTYYANYLINTIGKPNEMAARKKCLTLFRKTMTSLNKAIKTPQINQCDQTWNQIDFDKNVTSITMRKQSYAFQNIKKNNKSRFNKTEEAEIDRKECSINYKNYIKRCAENKSVAKGANISMVDFVKSAITVITMTETSETAETRDLNNKDEISIINSQWKNNSLNTKNLGNILAMIDTSASMGSPNNIPLYSAIALGIRVAEKSALGKRVLTFSNKPEWINLENNELDNGFVDMVKKIRNSHWGMNTNFYEALKLILNTAIEQKIDPSTMENMTLAIFSDMQIDHASNENMNSMFENITKLYTDAGLKSTFKQPYNVPHILFWNLRTTDGFPCISSTKNTSMMSGSSPALLNLFCEKGLEGLKECTPWNMMQEVLSNKRYHTLDITFKNIWKKTF